MTVNGFDLSRMQTEAARIVKANADLRAENARLRDLHRVPHWHAIVTKAELDAERMLRLRYAGTRPDRAVCKPYGITERRWHWALSLLRASGVYGTIYRYHRGGQMYTRYDVKPRLSLDGAIATMQGKAEELRGRPDGLEILRALNSRESVCGIG